MTWLVWRQHRTQAAIGAVALAAFALLLLITGRQMAAQFHSYLATCTAARNCQWPANNLVLGTRITGFLVEVTLAVPAVLGMFWGAPVVARELETGTGQFIWMQSVSRSRWLAVKIGWMVLAALAWGGAVAALVTWWSGPRNAAYLDAFEPGTFDVQGIVPVAYALFAMALGIAVGALLRRSLPALAVTLGGYFAVRTAITSWIRPHYMTAVTTTYRLTQAYQPAGAFWQYAKGLLTPGGAVVSTSASGGFPIGEASGGAGPISGVIPVNTMPASCRALVHLSGGAPQASYQAVISCLSSHGYRNYITYQPASRYWAFQGIETGIFTILAVALITATAIVVLRRDA